MCKMKIIALFIAFFGSSAANAVESWYIINNYEGKVGSSLVHVSIQYYDFGKETNVEGSYYYDKYLSPIPLYGKKIHNSIELCEVSGNKEYDANLVEGKNYNSSDCPFKLTEKGMSLRGIWKDGNKQFDVRLDNTASLTRGSLYNTSTNKIEVPFWGQTDSHSFIGVYERSDNELEINTVKVINKKTGRVDQVINPQLHNCDFGFYMTAAYQNIEKDEDPSQIRLNCYSTGSDNSVGYYFDKKSKSYKFSYK